MTPYAGRFIAVCWLVFGAYWTVTALSVKRTVATQGKNWSLRFSGIALVMLLLIRKVPAIAHYASLRLWPSRYDFGVVADLLAFVGLAIMLWARSVIGRNWSGGVVLKEDHEIVTSGPYAYVRHPIYTGLLTLMLSTAIYWGVVFGFAFFIVFSGVFWYKSTFEERFMTEHFPDKYPAYMKRVKALIPWIF